MSNQRFSPYADEAFYEWQAKQWEEKCEQATIEVIEVAKTFRPSFSVSEAKRQVITETIDEAHQIDDPEWSFDVEALIRKLSCLLDLDAVPDWATVEEQLDGMFPL